MEQGTVQMPVLLCQSTCITDHVIIQYILTMKEKILVLDRRIQTKLN